MLATPASVVTLRIFDNKTIFMILVNIPYELSISRLEWTARGDHYAVFMDLILHL